MAEQVEPDPGFKWPVSAVQTIAAPAAAVWEAISKPGSLEDGHPFCESNPVIVWPGSGARDEIHYLNGWVFERRFRRWIEGIGYDLEIGRRGGRSSFVSWRISDVSESSSSLRITVYPHVLLDIHPLIRWLPHGLRLRPMLRRYLVAVTKGYEWYATKGTPVPRNHFGSHPWFS